MAAGSPPRPRGVQVEYPDVRAQIQDGDVLLFQGTHWLSRFIRWGSGSAYSHAGVALWWGPRLMVVQAVGKGVQAVPLSLAVDTYSGQVDWYQPLPEVRAGLRMDLFIAAALDEVGKPFAVRGLVRLAWLLWQGRLRKHRDPRRPASEHFCSQLVSYCYRVAQADLVDGRADAHTSPGDLARCGRLVLRAALNAPPQATASPPAPALGAGV
jgi:hypothetical protein